MGFTTNVLNGTVPMKLLAMIKTPNRPLITEPVAFTMANSTPRIALIGVNTLARTMSATLRVARLGTSLTLRSATRWATSASVSPVASDDVMERKPIERARESVDSGAKSHSRLLAFVLWSTGPPNEGRGKGQQQVPI
jgi:hypothetical protein